VSVFNKIPAGFCPTMSYGSRKQSYDQGGCFWRITSSPSQVLRRRLVRTTDDAVSAQLDAVHHGFIFHTSRLVGLTTV